MTLTMTMKKTLLSIWGLLLGSILAYGQANISPAPAQSKPVVITGATIHVGNGQVINNGYIAFDKGKITAIGEGAPASTNGADVIDATGKQVYPGFICPTTTLGLIDIEEGARGTDDVEETGEINPNVRSIIAYNTDSKVIPTVRSNGILLAQPTPQGGLISGQSSVVQLDAWNWEDAAYKKDIALHMNWPVLRATGRRRAQAGTPGTPQETPEEHQQKQLDAIYSLFSQAKAYAEAKPATINLRFEAMPTAPKRSSRR
jgi:hypothetical protein